MKQLTGQEKEGHEPTPGPVRVSVSFQSKIQNPKSKIGSSSGFTLIELIVVTTLAVLILGLTTLFFGNAIPSARFDATGRDLIATMRHTRAIARTSGEDQVLTIDLDGRRYGIEGGRMKDVPPGIGLLVDDSLIGAVRSGTYPIIFHTMGGVEGGTIVLSYKAKTVRVQSDPILGARAERS